VYADWLIATLNHHVLTGFTVNTVCKFSESRNIALFSLLEQLVGNIGQSLYPCLPLTFRPLV